MEAKNLHTCSFCWRTSKEVDFMVAGPDMVNICENCVAVCARIIEDRKKGECGTDDMKTLQNKLRVAQIARTKGLNMELDNNYREKLSSLYFEIEDVLGKMDVALKFAKDCYADISKDDATEVHRFLTEADRLIKSYFELFAKFSEK